MAKSKVKKRPDGRYAMQIYLGTVDGKRKYKTVYGTTIKEVERKAAEIRAQLGKGLDILGKRDKFSVWADDFLKLKQASNITAAQKYFYAHVCGFWKRALDGYSIADVRADDVERWLLWMQEGGYAAKTIKNYKTVIRLIMQRAVGRVIASNPVDLVNVQGVGRKGQQRRALTPEEQKWILDTPHFIQPAAVIMMYSGLRRGELTALTWPDVDLTAKTIRVNKTVEFPPGHPAFVRPFTKTAAGMRVVDIPQILADYLASLPRRDYLVFPSPDGGIMAAHQWEKQWESYLRVLDRKYGKHPENRSGVIPLKELQKKKELTIPRITMHWLRHTFCTMLYLAGEDVAYTCAQMGHSNITTTWKIYTHLDTLYRRKASGKLDQYISGGDASQMQVRGS